MADVVKRQVNDVENHEPPIMQSITSKIWLVSGSVEQYKRYFMAVWQYGQYYSHHYRGQVNALLPDALWPRAIVR